MDLGIAGRSALVCASSKGLGLACARALGREGVEVTLNGRDQTRLDAAARQIAAETGRKPRTVVADLSDEAGREVLLRACLETDILINNNGGPPPGSLPEWDHGTWLKAIEANMLTPILLIRAYVPGMRARRFGRIVNITSAMVKTPRPHMALSTTARTGLTAFAKSLSLDVAKDNVTINNLLPERVDTDRQVFMAERTAKEEGIPYDAARTKIAEGVAARRFGRPEEFGDACAYLCSAQAGFISGQNLSLDGGSYTGLL